MFGTTNIVVSINPWVFVTAVLWHQVAQYMVIPIGCQDSSRAIGPLA